MEITKVRHWLIAEQEGFVARFLDQGSRDLEQLQDLDIRVTVTGGPTYYVTLMTLDAIDTVLRRWAHTGEHAGGSYYWETDLVIVPRPGITAMIKAIDGLIRDRNIAQACQVIPDLDDDPDAA
ncbi:hypothetical protein ACQP1P_13230 [Dactylosporangium sp. CA-052675]|uniref:hypothetical protein n=1 Tax=Dactylosporangium sp. CA-052675 TaxID=3239927 RepID=UPI003D8ED6B5